MSVQTLYTAATGMESLQTKLDVIANNLANVNTTRTPEGGPYRRKEVVFEARSKSDSFREVLQSRQGRQPAGVRSRRGSKEASSDPSSGVPVVAFSTRSRGGHSCQ